MNTEEIKNQSIIKIEIWSDVICPFCYMGKRKLENALSSFKDKFSVEIEWKSFLLDPTIPEKMEVSVNVYEYLAKRKGISIEQSIELHKNVSYAAGLLGLNYNFDKTVVANTLNAHRLLHLAKKTGKQNEVKEKLLNSYFTQGKNINDHQTLLDLAREEGLDSKEVEDLLTTNNLKEEVKEDILEAQSLGVRGVPFFVFNRKYAISGAQDTSVFVDLLNKISNEKN